jgi:transcriptional regulator with XRE-family HTH domain
MSNMEIDNFNTDQEVVAEIAARIRNLRLNDSTNQMSQQALAKRAGISRSTVARFEQKGEISLMPLIAILRVMKLLPNINQLVPENIALSPMQISKMKSKNVIRQRIRK